MNTPFVPNIKYLKKHRRRVKSGVETRRIHLVFANFGIVASEDGKIFSHHVEMMRKTITNYFKRNTKVYIRCFPNRSYTRKPFDVRRGSGKGAVESWYYFARRNKVLADFTCSSLSEAKNVARIVNSKLPIAVHLLDQNTDNKLKDKKHQDSLQHIAEQQKNMKKNE
ncbi:50S ribosomal protein L16 [bacterium AB1]|nr:50S ribosomal protein L16 [bacterium AB1]